MITRFSGALFALAASLSLAEELPTSADLVLVNGKVFTCDAENSAHEAVAIRGDHFVAVGTSDEIRELVGDETRVIDLNGQLLLPGFIDTHVHPISKMFPNLLDVSDAVSIAEIRELVATRAKELDEGEWVRGFGWDEEQLEEGRALTRDDLDSVSHGHPVLLAKRAWHAEAANSMALRLADITKDTEDPIGGEIVRDAETGEPTGVLKETAGGLIYPLIPARPDDARIGLQRSCAELLKHGVTTAFMSNEYPATIRTYQDLFATRPEPLARVVARPRLVVGDGLPGVLNERISGWPFVTGFGNEWVQIGELKIFVDGGVSTQSSLLWEPYASRPDHYGTQAIPTRTLNRVVRHAHGIGWQIHFHVTGDKAVSLALDAIEAAQRTTPRDDARHSITHTYLIRDEDLDRIANLNVIVVAQPSFVTAFGARYEREFGEERLQRVLPIKSLLDRGIHVALSSDNLPIGAFSGLYSAIHRVDDNGREIGRDEEITIEQAIRAYTIAGAYLSREESTKGSIEVGKLADAVVVDRDLLSVSADQVKDAEVVMTVQAGAVVYQREH